MFSGSRPSTFSGMLYVSIKNFQTKSYRYMGNINGCADMGVFEMFFDESCSSSTGAPSSTPRAPCSVVWSQDQQQQLQLSGRVHFNMQATYL